jgi:hypothetical protein
MKTKNPIQEIYRIVSMGTKSKEVQLGIFQEMLAMHQLDNLPQQEIGEIRKVIQKIEQEIKQGK